MEPPNDDASNDESVSSQSLVPNKARSWVWQYCTVIDRERAKCQICEVELSYRNSTTVLIRHLRSFHREKITMIEVSKPNAEENPLSKEENNFIDKELCKFIARDILPISFTENVGFRNFVKVLNPRYQPPCRQTVLKYLSENSKSLKKNIMNLFRQEALVTAATTDIWTSRAKDSYIDITLHWINNSFEMRQVMVDLIYLNADHTADYIKEKLEEVLGEWNLKPISITADNGSNIVAAINKMDTKRIPCAGHTLQLSVNAGLSHISSFIEKCRKIVAIFTRSSKKTQYLER